MINNIIWDMGGTMVNTYPQVDAMLMKVVENHGYTVSWNDVAALTRSSTGTAIRTLSQRFGIAEEEFRRAEKALKLLWESEPAPAMPGLREVMEAIPGLNLVVTHRDRRSAQALLDGLGIHVDGMVCQSDGFARKPSPEMFAYMMEKYQLDPVTTIAVGDRPIDIQVAHKVGVRAALLETEGVDIDMPEADWHIKSLKEILPLIS